MENGIVYQREDHPGQHLYVCRDLETKVQTHFIHVVIWGEKVYKVEIKDNSNIYHKPDY